MDQRRQLVLKAFLSRSNPEARMRLERFLPENERLNLAELPHFESKHRLGPYSDESLLEKVHWSWFLPTLKSFTEKEQNLFLAALSPTEAENLRQALSIEETTEELTQAAQSFLRQQLLQTVAGSKGPLPAAYLPESPLNELLHLNKKQLTALIDLLALYDLAAELRQIVETKILKKIYSFLTDEQKKALKKISAYKETHSLPRLGLDRWDGEEETLRNLLHKRGLARLGLALSGSSPDLIWAICHRLDIGRGTTLFKLCANHPSPGVTDGIIRQIEELLEKL